MRGAPACIDDPATAGTEIGHYGCEMKQGGFMNPYLFQKTNPHRPARRKQLHHPSSPQIHFHEPLLRGDHCSAAGIEKEDPECGISLTTRR